MTKLEFDATQGWREGAAPISAKKNAPDYSEAKVETNVFDLLTITFLHLKYSLQRRKMYRQFGQSISLDLDLNFTLGLTECF